jgi:hypothetical protein
LFSIPYASAAILNGIMQIGRGAYTASAQSIGIREAKNNSVRGEHRPNNLSGIEVEKVCGKFAQRDFRFHKRRTKIEKEKRSVQQDETKFAKSSRRSHELYHSIFSVSARVSQKYLPFTFAGRKFFQI